MEVDPHLEMIIKIHQSIEKMLALCCKLHNENVSMVKTILDRIFFFYKETEHYNSQYVF